VIPFRLARSFVQASIGLHARLVAISSGQRYATVC